MARKLTKDATTRPFLVKSNGGLFYTAFKKAVTISITYVLQEETQVTRLDKETHCVPLGRMKRDLL